MLLSLLSRRTLEGDSRDSYGFAVRPQHLQRYREYGTIYKEEEQERSEKWTNFLQQCSESIQSQKVVEENLDTSEANVDTEGGEAVSEIHIEGDDSSGENSVSSSCKEGGVEKEVLQTKDTKRQNIHTWASLRPSLGPIETMMCLRVKKRVCMADKPVYHVLEHLPPITEENSSSENMEKNLVTKNDITSARSHMDLEKLVNVASDTFSGVRDISDIQDQEIRIPDSICQTDAMLDKSFHEKSKSDDKVENTNNIVKTESLFPWKEELESLVHGGVPKSLRGEVWQAFVGVRARKIERYYQKMLYEGVNSSESNYLSTISSNGFSACEPEKLKKQIEKDLPRTFPGHPALDEEGRNSLRRILIAYARHNPSVGYCQILVVFDAFASIMFYVFSSFREAMNFFAGLFLLLMPEENAFWMLVGIIDDYFDGYYTHEMIESQHFSSVSFGTKEKDDGATNLLDLMKLKVADSTGKESGAATLQSCFRMEISNMELENLKHGITTKKGFREVDQLVFEELMRERFPKLVNHLDYLGVEVAWVSGPWFLSIFMNMLPWESVLRVWDVLLYEGNRVMLFRTALALMELYGPALVTTQDAADAVSLLQSLTGSTFDSSQLVFTACMGFLCVTEARLEELREKHRPSVLGIIEERTKGSEVSKESKSLASKLYSFKQDAQLLMKEPDTAEGLSEKLIDSVRSEANSSPDNFDEFMCALSSDTEIDSSQDNREQVVWLKVELCRLMEDKRAATLRAEELETAFLEMVKQDNRRELSARAEQLEQEVSVLRQALSDKKEQEHAMLQVFMRVEQEQKVAEDARIAAEKEVVAQKYAVVALQEKYEQAMKSLVEMEKRVVMAESMLQATLQFESGQAKAQASPRYLVNSSRGIINLAICMLLS
ncbi:hypothetical protein KSS87_004765 [Heliosperma pusillum]|nr:hypothetical protein KSS87_004765 [Heliosperma pusillum]